MAKHILIDLDGTITDSGEGIIKSVQYALKAFSITVEKEDEHKLAAFIGPPLLDSFQRYFGFSVEQAKKAQDKHREYYLKQGIYENKLYDGIENVLKTFKEAGKTLILATAKPMPHAKIVLDYFKLDKYFDYTFGSEIDGTRSFKNEVIAYAMQQIPITDPTQAVMIGDREHDMQGAVENHIRAIGVLYGYGSKKELLDSGASALAKTPSELLQLLL